MKTGAHLWAIAYDDVERAACRLIAIVDAERSRVRRLRTSRPDR